MKSGTEMIEEARARIKEVSARSLVENAPNDVVYVDCREPNEWNLGHIPNAVFIPRGKLEQNIEAAVDREQKVIIYCASGNRSVLAAETLQQMGYKDVASMSGGIREWADSGGEIES